MAPVFRSSPVPCRRSGRRAFLHWTRTNNYSSLAYHPIVRLLPAWRRLAASDISPSVARLPLPVGLGSSALRPSLATGLPLSRMMTQ